MWRTAQVSTGRYNWKTGFTSATVPNKQEKYQQPKQDYAFDSYIYATLSVKVETLTALRKHVSDR